ncbi:related to multidrug resistance protein [Fusarium torulosum]|uniref:Related to multidrug resistance protein n=1 Tax=Fusarium torulosum TaxID=33205 RepID=A0AAE8M5B0_9HYPO|nr:related to multidrug resistance protein [Fusarium torulosum]
MPSLSTSHEPTEASPLLRDNDSEHINSGNIENGQVEGNDTLAAVYTTKKLNLLLGAVGIGIFLAAADQLLTVATYGRIGSELNALNNTSWIATAYFLTLTSCQPLYGKLSDIFGRKACLLFAYTIFALGCLGCGLAQSMAQLCIARAVAGMGGGAMNSLVAILLSDLVPLKDRGVWQGKVSILYFAGTATGAPLGGLLADSVGWRWSFLGQVPLCFVAFIAVYFVLDLPPPEQDHWLAKVRKVDFLGAFILVAAVIALLAGLDFGSNFGWSHIVTVVSLSMTPGLSATKSGSLLVPGMASAVISSILSGMIIKRTEKFYSIMMLGYALVLVSILPLGISVWLRSTPGEVIGIALMCFGSGSAFVTTLIALLANATVEDTAVVVACSYLFRSLGSSIGISTGSAVLQQMLRTQLAARLPDGKEAREIEERVRQSLDYIKELPPHLAEQVRSSYQMATIGALVVTSIYILVSFLMAFWIKEKPLKR